MSQLGPDSTLPFKYKILDFCLQFSSLFFVYTLCSFNYQSHAEKGEHWWFQTCIPGLLIHKKRRLVSSWSHLWKSSKRSLIGCAWWSLTQSPCPTKSSAEIVLYWMECPTLFVCGAGGGVGQRTGRGPTTDSSVKII